jgi:hypothetical protein
MDKLELEEYLHELSEQAKALIDLGEGVKVGNVLKNIRDTFNSINERVEREMSPNTPALYNWHTHDGLDCPVTPRNTLIEIRIRNTSGNWSGKAVAAHRCTWIWDEEFDESDILEWRIAPPNLPRVELL